MLNLKLLIKSISIDYNVVLISIRYIGLCKSINQTKSTYDHLTIINKMKIDIIKVVNYQNLSRHSTKNRHNNKHFLTIYCSTKRKTKTKF